MNYDLADVERELCRIPEVRAARIVADSAGTPVEVHVLAAPGKHAKQVVRDIQSVAMATVGLSIDHRIVSVVQLDDPTVQHAQAAATQAAPAASESPHVSAGNGLADGDTRVVVLDEEPPAEPAFQTPPAPAAAAVPSSAPAATDVGRIIVERVTILRRGFTCTAEVVLRLGDEIVTGDADGSSAANATLRLTAEATLDALRQLHPGARRAALESAFLTRNNDRTIALTSLVLMVPPNEELVTGSAPVRGAGEHEAVARSVLDAMNRRLHERR